MRPPMSTIILKVAELMAERSTCSTRHKVGAVLADEDMRIVATGYNGAPRGMDHCDDVGCDLDPDGHCRRAIHAEENCLLQCAYFGVRTSGLILFCTHRPCYRCSLKLKQAGISHVFYTHEYDGPVITVPGLFIYRE